MLMVLGANGWWFISPAAFHLCVCVIFYGLLNLESISSPANMVLLPLPPLELYHGGFNDSD